MYENAPGYSFEVDNWALGVIMYGVYKYLKLNFQVYIISGLCSILSSSTIENDANDSRG